MINITVAQCKSVMDSEEKDLKALLILMAGLAFLASLLIVAGMGFWAVLPIAVIFAMVIPLIDYFQKWSKRIRQLIEICKNVPGHIDF